MVFYFAGHGIQDQEFGHLLLPPNVRYKDLKSARSNTRLKRVVRVADLEEAMGECGAGRLILLDACRSAWESSDRHGQVELSAETARDLELVVESASRKETLQEQGPLGIICGCSAREKSYELRDRGGVFTYGLIASLRAVRDAGEAFRLPTRIEMVQSNMERLLRDEKRDWKQRPFVKMGGGIIELLAARPSRAQGIPSNIVDPHSKEDESKSIRSNLQQSASRQEDHSLSFKPGLDFKIEGMGMEMVWVEPGTFEMGGDLNGDEKPKHEVTLTEGYWLGKYPVTQGEWGKIMGSNPSEFKDVGKNAPVESVSWEDAQEFIKKLNTREGSAGRLPGGYKYALPTEAQWEYACRAGTTTEFTYGDSLSSRQANFDGDYPYGGASKGPFLNKITEVGSYAPNAWGLYDMHGNVCEWCEDWYGEDYYKSSPNTDPDGPASGVDRVLRGGSWNDLAGNCRSADRGRGSPSFRDGSIGFRLALRSNE